MKKNNDMVRFYENGEIVTKVEYKWYGYGVHAQSIFCKFITTFSIANGIIIDRKFVKPNCWVR